MLICFKNYITFKFVSAFRWNRQRRNTWRSPSQISARTVRTETRFKVRMVERWRLTSALVNYLTIVNQSQFIDGETSFAFSNASSHGYETSANTCLLQGRQRSPEHLSPHITATMKQKGSYKWILTLVTASKVVNALQHPTILSILYKIYSVLTVRTH